MPGLALAVVFRAKPVPVASFTRFGPAGLQCIRTPSVARVTGTVRLRATAVPQVLHLWRQAPLDRRRKWQDLAPIEDRAGRPEMDYSAESSDTLSAAAVQVLSSADLTAKCQLTHQAWTRACAPQQSPVGNDVPPARPARPELPQVRGTGMLLL